MDYWYVADMMLNSTSSVVWPRSTDFQLQNYSQYVRHSSKALCSLSNYISLLFVFAFPLLIPYVYSCLASHSELDRGCQGRLPPTAHYNVPGLGHMLSFAWDMPGFLTSIRLFQTSCVFGSKVHNI